MSGSRRSALVRASIGAALALYSAWELRFFLEPGIPVFLDAASHVTRTGFVAQALEQGELPFWSNAWYGGYRLLEFYSPLYFWLSGALAWGVGDAILASKLWLWVALTALVALYYRLLLRLVESPWLAAACAVLLLKSSLVRWNFGTLANWPSSVPLLVLPVLLAHVVRQAGPRGSPLALFAGSALGVGAMAAGHLTNTAMLMPGFLLFAGGSLWIGRDSLPGFLRRTAALALGLAGAVALTAFVWLPSLVDASKSSMGLVPGTAVPLPNLGSLGVVAGVSRFTMAFMEVRYQGPWFLPGALAIALLAPAPFGRRWRPAALALVATLGVVTLPSAGRAFQALPLYVGALYGLALAAGAEALGRRWGPRAAAAIPVAALAWTLVWPGLEPENPVPHYEPAEELDPYPRLSREPGTGRVLDLTLKNPWIDGFYGWSCIAPHLAGRSIPFGCFPQGSPIEINVAMALASPWHYERNRGAGHWSESALDVLMLLGVEYLVERRDPAAFRPRERGTRRQGRRVADRLFRLADASPLLFSQRLAPLPPPFRSDGGRTARNPLLELLGERWKAGVGPLKGDLLYVGFAPVLFTRHGHDWGLGELVQAMGIDRRRRTARTLFSAGGEAGVAPPADARPSLEVLEHVEELQRVEIRARASAPGFVRVSYSYDPELRVRLDGQPVEPIPDALGSGFALRFPEGAHEIVIRPPVFALRKALTAAALPLAALLLAVRVAARDQRTAAGSRGSAEISASVPTA